MDQKYWLAENGEVRCLDDRCPQECDMGCPIFLQTLAIEQLQMNNYKEAAGYLEKAVKIEPTFAEAWNNLGACFGQMGNHQGAYEAYLKSFELVQKPKPLYGLAVASKKMGKYALAKQYIGMYINRYGEDEKIKEQKADIAELELTANVDGGTKGRGTGLKPQNDMQLYGSFFLQLLNEGTREKGYAEMEKMESRFPEAGIVVGQYYQGTDPDRAKKHFKVAADAGIAEGQWNYSQLLLHSYVLDLSNAEDQKYLKWCRASAEGGCPDAANEMGNICHRKGFYEESTYWYGMAYSLEHPSGMVGLRGITKEWAQQGIAKEYSAHLDGFTEEMHTTSLKLYKMFNESLEVEDMNELMTLALGGENLAGFILAKVMEQSNQDEMAYTIYNALSFSNHPYALRCCADMLLNGKGTTRDMPAAFRAYEKAAKRGNAVAMFAMGQKAYKDGDPLTAAAWFGMAYSRGMDMAGDWLTKLANQS